MVDLPEGMPKEVFQHLKKTWVCGRQLNISRLNESGESRKPKKSKMKDKKKMKNKKRKNA
jgi:ATP-dependent RNA helicase DeaD